MPFQIETWMVHYRHRQLPISNFQWDAEIKHEVEDGQGTQTESCLLEGAWQRAGLTSTHLRAGNGYRKAAYSVGLKESVEQSSVEGKSSLTAHSSLRVRTQAAVSISLLSNWEKVKILALGLYPYHPGRGAATDGLDGKGLAVPSLCLEVKVNEVLFQPVNSFFLHSFPLS